MTDDEANRLTDELAESKQRVKQLEKAMGWVLKSLREIRADNPGRPGGPLVHHIKALSDIVEGMDGATR